MLWGPPGPQSCFCRHLRETHSSLAAGVKWTLGCVIVPVRPSTSIAAPAPHVEQPAAVVAAAAHSPRALRRALGSISTISTVS